MALLPNEIDCVYIKSYINSFGFKSYEQVIKGKLGITEVEYDTMIGLWACKNGFPTSAMASTIFKKDHSGIDYIKFFIETVKEYVNYTFGRIQDRVIFKEIANICIKYALIHELAHVSQFKQGKITKEYFDKDGIINKTEIEEEANLRAVEILSSYEDFHAKIATIIAGSKSIDNDSVREIIDLYNRYSKSQSQHHTN